MKTGVIKAQRIEPLLNEAYRELADYYRTIIVPSRVRKPKDKASVEGTVGFISRQIIASLRNYQCFHLDDLNQQIHEKLEEINEIDFQKRPGSRKKVFEEEEKSHLHPLPPNRYKLAEWKTAKVQLNYHIQVERMYYSVPYEYVREQVDVRIASHKRLREEVGQFSTNPDHMPDNHRSYLEHTPENNQKWAESVGPSMDRLVAHILKQNPEKKALTILSSLRNISNKHTNDVLETATETLLEISTNPTIPVLKGILDRRNKNKSKSNEPIIHHKNHGFTRGAKYFGGERI